MLLLKFELEDLKKCKSVSDVYRAMGIGINEDDSQDLNFNNKAVFGKRAYYRNLFVTDRTYNEIHDILEKVPNYKRRSAKKDKIHIHAFQWSNYSPMSSGPRYQALESIIGELNDEVLYILTPEDNLYEEDPHAEEN